MQINSFLQATNSLLSLPLHQDISKMSFGIPKTSESIILMDIYGNIEYVNPVFSEGSGYSLEEAIELNFKTIICERTSGYIYIKLWSEILSGNEWKGKLHFKKKEGEVELAEAIISPVKNKNGEIAHFIMTKSVILESGEQEKKINNLIRFGYFGNIFCSLMHELKSHFALIKMNFNLLKPSSASEKTIYSIIARDLERVNKLFSNFSQFSKDKELEIIDLNINNVIDYSFTSVKTLIQDKKIKFFNNVEPFILKGDYQQLKSLFKNLIENAIDAIENEGIIEVSSKIRKEYFSIFLKDNGCGIKNSHNIFEPFYTTKAKGTGLGLAIAKKIIEEHNGTIYLTKCEPGETVFEIKFPL